MRKKGKDLKVGDHVQFRFSGGHHYVRGIVMPGGEIKIYASQDDNFEYAVCEMRTNVWNESKYIMLE